MLQKKAIISYLGIDKDDMRIIRNMFQQIKWLQKIFILRMLRADTDPDILLINADNKEALSIWRQIKSQKNCISIMLSSSGQYFKDAITLQRPIELKLFERILESIAATDKIHGLNENMLSDSLDVLVVDDSKPVRKYMEQKLPQLYSSKVTMDFAASGEESARKVRKNVYDIIFLDVVMPGVDGYKVCKWIKANSVAHVVMLTSKGSPFDKIRGTMSGCNAYLVKPPDDESLKAILENYNSKIKNQQYAQQAS